MAFSFNIPSPLRLTRLDPGPFGTPFPPEPRELPPDPPISRRGQAFRDILGVLMAGKRKPHGFGVSLRKKHEMFDDVSDAGNRLALMKFLLVQPRYIPNRNAFIQTILTGGSNPHFRAALPDEGRPDPKRSGQKG